MKLIVDAQLPPLLAAMLREAGYDAHALRDIGLKEEEGKKGSGDDLDKITH